VSTLVVCLHRGADLGVDSPVVGREAVESLVTTLGVEDPEDSRVNCLLEGLRVAGDVDDAIVAFVSVAGESVATDREVARQVEALVEDHDPDSAVVVVDSAEDERMVPIIESRVTVDAVDRVVVRQARDIESTYYLLKQFLADEQLRKTVLIPLGATLLAVPILLYVAESPTVAVGAIAAAAGLFLLYKGLGIDTYVGRIPSGTRDALYSGQVSLVTYVVAVGLALVGLFAGAIGVSGMESEGLGEFILAMRFAYHSIPWVTAAALAAAMGRLIDELIREDELGSAYVNLPFVAIAVGLAIRGFSVYFLERSGVFEEVSIPATEVGPVSVDGLLLASGSHLALFVLASILVSLVGVRVAAYVSSSDVEVGIEQRRS